MNLIYQEIHSINFGALIAQWVKRLPTDLVVQCSIPAQGEIFSTVNGVPLQSVSLSAFCSDMTEMLFKRM